MFSECDVNLWIYDTLIGASCYLKPLRAMLFHAGWIVSFSEEKNVILDQIIAFTSQKGIDLHH